MDLRSDFGRARASPWNRDDRAPVSADDASSFVPIGRSFVTMRSVQRLRRIIPLLLVSFAFGTVPAFAQLDLSGVWAPNIGDEDNPERLGGPALVDYVGLPINDHARQWGLAYRSGRLSLPEHQCQVHVVHYIHRGPMQMRIWEERDPVTHRLIAIREYVNTYEQNRTIWMDGRPHPSPNAPHTWMGFSTGVWEGNMLTVTTTHIKQGWFRRNGLPSSDEATTIEHFVRSGDSLVHISVTEDPNFLAEPLVKTEDFNLVANPNNFTAFWPCEYIEEGGWDQGDVPHYLPGEHPYLTEYAATHDLPLEATLGGPETMYPEFRQRMEELPDAEYNPDE
jgi:hypothetical protein